MRLSKLLEGINRKTNMRLADIDIESVSADSRTVKKGGLFVAIDGFKTDGHKFIREAFARGAVLVVTKRRKKALEERNELIEVDDTRGALAIIAKNFYSSPSEKLKVVGITGTNGKTTTSLLIESIFNCSGMPCGVIGTIKYGIGKKSFPAARTTPDALSVNALLDRMLKERLRAVVMEVSSHALDQKRVDGIYFDTAVFTNLTHEHLDYHESMRRYLASKASIFANLKPGGSAVINVDDVKVKTCLKKIARRKCVTYGLDSSADISAGIKNAGLDGSSFDIKIRKKSAFSVDTKLPGMHNVSNILAAIAVAFSHGIDFPVIKKAIKKIDRIEGRLEPVEAEKGVKIFVDYAHTHNALENVLGFLRQHKKRNIITVFGCGGDRDRGKRPLMGLVAQRLSDFVIITSDNPRSESPAEIARDIEKGMDRKKGNYAVILDRRSAIEKALKKAEKGDIVLLAGKGHEKTQVIGQKEMPFDDKKVAAGLLRNQR